MQKTPTVSVWPAKGSHCRWEAPTGRKSRSQDFPPSPAHSGACVEDWAISSQGSMRKAASLLCPLKMISTEQVTAPPSFLRTIVSWIHGSLVLWLLPPHCWGLMSEVVWQWVLVSHVVFSLTGPKMLLSVQLGDGLAEALALWVRQSGVGTFPVGSK